MSNTVHNYITYKYYVYHYLLYTPPLDGQALRFENSVFLCCLLKNMTMGLSYPSLSHFFNSTVDYFLDKCYYILKIYQINAKL